MKITESRIRRIIREELLKEDSEDTVLGKMSWPMAPGVSDPFGELRSSNPPPVLSTSMWYDLDGDAMLSSHKIESKKFIEHLMDTIEHRGGVANSVANAGHIAAVYKEMGVETRIAPYPGPKHWGAGDYESWGEFPGSARSFFKKYDPWVLDADEIFLVTVDNTSYRAPGQKVTEIEPEDMEMGVEYGGTTDPAAGKIKRALSSLLGDLTLPAHYDPSPVQLTAAKSWLSQWLPGGNPSPEMARAMAATNPYNAVWETFLGPIKECLSGQAAAKEEATRRASKQDDFYSREGADITFAGGATSEDTQAVLKQMQKTGEAEKISDESIGTSSAGLCASARASELIALLVLPSGQFTLAGRIALAAGLVHLARGSHREAMFELLLGAFEIVAATKAIVRYTAVVKSALRSGKLPADDILEEMIKAGVFEEHADIIRRLARQPKMEEEVQAMRQEMARVIETMDSTDPLKPYLDAYVRGASSDELRGIYKAAKAEIESGARWDIHTSTRRAADIDPDELDAWLERLEDLPLTSSPGSRKAVIDKYIESQISINRALEAEQATARGAGRGKSTPENPWGKGPEPKAIRPAGSKAPLAQTANMGRQIIDLAYAKLRSIPDGKIYKIAKFERGHFSDVDRIEIRLDGLFDVDDIEKIVDDSLGDYLNTLTPPQASRYKQDVIEEIQNLDFVVGPRTPDRVGQYVQSGPGQRGQVWVEPFDKEEWKAIVGTNRDRPDFEEAVKKAFIDALDSGTKFDLPEQVRNTLSHELGHWIDLTIEGNKYDHLIVDSNGIPMREIDGKQMTFDQAVKERKVKTIEEWLQDPPDIFGDFVTQPWHGRIGELDAEITRGVTDFQDSLEASIKRIRDLDDQYKLPWDISPRKPPRDQQPVASDSPSAWDRRSTTKHPSQTTRRQEPKKWDDAETKSAMHKEEMAEIGLDELDYTYQILTDKDLFRDIFVGDYFPIEPNRGYLDDYGWVGSAENIVDQKIDDVLFEPGGLWDWARKEAGINVEYIDMQESVVYVSRWMKLAGIK